MSEEFINTGIVANDGTGDSLRAAFIKTSNNFAELYYHHSNVTANLVNTNLEVANNWANIQNNVWKTNAAYRVVNAAYTSVNINFTTTNAVYTMANMSFNTTNAAWDMLNAAYVVANSNYDVTNAAYTMANMNYTVTNSAYTMANMNYTVTNAAYTMANMNYTVTNAAYTMANMNYTVTNAAYTMANMNYTVTNAAYTMANANYVVTNSVFEQSNTDNVRLTESYTVTNAAYTMANANYVVTNSAYVSLNACYIVTNSAFDFANTANSDINLKVDNIDSRLTGNVNYLESYTGLLASALVDVSISANNYSGAMANSANNYSNTSVLSVNAYANLSTSSSNNYSGFMANSANAYAGAMVNSANSLATSYYNTNQSYIGNTALAANNYSGFMANSANAHVDNTYLKLVGGTVTGDLQVTGNLSVTGNYSVIGVETFRVSDSLIYLAANNYTSDLIDIGFVANYVNTSSINVHTGLFRSASTKEYYLFQGYDTEPTANNSVVPYSNNMVNAVLHADFNTSNLKLGSANAIVWISTVFETTNASYTSVNSAYVVSNSGYTVSNAVFGVVNTMSTFVNTSFAAGNAYSAVVGVNANTYANTVLITAREYTNTSVTAANNYSNTKLANTTGTLAGDLTVAGNVIITGTKAGYSQNRPGFRVYGYGNTSNLTITTNGSGQLNANNYSVDFNQGGHLDINSGTFTAPVPGLYQINVVGRNSGHIAMSQLAVLFGSNVACMLEFDGNSTMNHAGVSTVVKMTAGDTLALRILSGVINFDSNDNWSVAYIG